MKHFECPEHDWRIDVEDADELEGYMRLWAHENQDHPAVHGL